VQKNCQIWLKFDVVITKIILLVFLLRHGVCKFHFLCSVICKGKTVALDRWGDYWVCQKLL